MSTCLSHLWIERRQMISGSDNNELEYSDQLEEMFGPPKALNEDKEEKKQGDDTWNLNLDLSWLS